MQLITGRTDTPGALTAFNKVFRDLQDAPGMCTALRREHNFQKIRVLKNSENAANHKKEPDCKAEKQFL